MKKSSPKKQRVFIAMSGGVDSSVAAFLLKQATPNNFEKLFGRPTPKGFRGYDVTGVFMRCYNLDGCAERDAEDARRVAEHIGIPFYVFDFEEEYKKKVVEYMIDGYRKGITPNPDVMCNKEIKFGLFLEKALTMGTPACRQAGIYIATGHYVRIAPRHISRGTGRLFAPAAKSGLDSRRVRSVGDQAERASETFRSKHAEELMSYFLLEAKDKNKDQSYFLWTLTQEQLKHCLFPIGNYLKSEVREIARKAGLPTAEKKDSQGICFLGKITLAEFLKKYIPENPGAVVTTAGEKVGEHSGAHFYTIGQRHGLGIGGGAPYYVAEKNIAENTLIVAEKNDSPALYRKEIELTEVNFIASQQHPYKLENVRMSVLARVRYRQPFAKATLNGQKLVFDEPQKFVASGQSAVFYSEESEMLGGGVIV